MAHRKQTTRRLCSEDPSVASVTTRRKSIPNVRAIMGRRRYTQHQSVLQELKKLQNCIIIAIPKLPFHLLSKKSMRYGLNFQWEESMLGWLHEAAKDFMVEIFQDNYILVVYASQSDCDAQRYKLSWDCWDFDRIRYYSHQ